MFSMPTDNAWSFYEFFKLANFVATEPSDAGYYLFILQVKRRKIFCFHVKIMIQEKSRRS